MASLFIFAGTTEGRTISEILSRNGFDCVVSVATEYGANLLQKGEHLTVLHGRMNAQEMASEFKKRDFSYIIDATHPFATEVSKEIKKACEARHIEYIRLSRDTSFDHTSFSGEHFFYFDTISQAADWLKSQSGTIFATTGSKELPILCKEIDTERIFARVLPSIESLELCARCSILQTHIIAMQGPFSEKANEIQFSESGAKILLTKESGAAGGYFEKIEAAQKLGMKIAVIKNPEHREQPKNAYSLSQIIEKLSRETGIALSSPADFAEKRLFLVGCGMGSETLLTEEAKTAIKTAHIVFGSERILKSAELFLSPQIPRKNLYKASDIFDFLKNHAEYNTAAVLFSGDTGFFSGAASFFEAQCLDWKIRVLNGVSAPIYFAAKLHKSWQNWKFLSLHGAQCNVIEEIRANPRCFLILSGAQDVKSVAAKIIQAQQNHILGEVNCYLGSNLSYDVEKIIQISPSDMRSVDSESLFVLLIENDHAKTCSSLPILRDEDFIRSEHIPMTKQEIRQISMCSLALSRSSVMYDIGSGTGSLTVEAARIAAEGQVVAIDCNEEAILATQKNAGKFCLENVTVLHGSAVEVLKTASLPAPTHAFIGGSKGDFLEICSILLQKNPSVRVVANFVSLEGVFEMQKLLSLGVKNLEIKQVSVSKSEKLGNFHMMKAQNPVWIVSFGGLEASDSLAVSGG